MPSQSPFYVTPRGRILPHPRQAAVIALFEGFAAVSLRDALPVTDRREVK